MSTTNNIDLGRLFATAGAQRLLPELVKLLDSNPDPDTLSAATAALKAVNLSNQRHNQNIHFVFQNTLDALLDCCQMDGVVLFSQLSIYFRVRVKNYVIRRLNALLMRFFEKPSLFRDAMRHTGTLISGSQALSFATSAPWEANDLDLYVGSGRDREDLVLHLTNLEGYQILQSNMPEVNPDVPVLYNSSQIRTVTKFYKKVWSKQLKTEVERRIDVIESVDPHPITPILRYHSSLVMNWITSDSITVAYPKFTFDKIGVVNTRLNMSHPRQQAWKDKYEARGYTFVVDTVELKGSCGAACPAIWRSTEDVACLTFKFGEEDAPEFDELQWSLSKGMNARYGYQPRLCRNRLCPQYRSHLPRKDGNAPHYGPFLRV